MPWAWSRSTQSTRIVYHRRFTSSSATFYLRDLRQVTSTPSTSVTACIEWPWWNQYLPHKAVVSIKVIKILGWGQSRVHMSVCYYYLENLYLHHFFHFVSLLFGNFLGRVSFKCLIGGSFFMILCWFLPYKNENQLYVYTCPPFL